MLNLFYSHSLGVQAEPFSFPKILRSSSNSTKIFSIRDAIILLQLKRLTLSKSGIKAPLSGAYENKLKYFQRI